MYINDGGNTHITDGSYRGRTEEPKLQNGEIGILTFNLISITYIVLTVIFGLLTI
jgi:hypothetical protein